MGAASSAGGRCERCDRPLATKHPSRGGFEAGVCYRKSFAWTNVLGGGRFYSDDDCDAHVIDWRARALAAERTTVTLETAIDAIHQSFNATIEELTRARGWARTWKRSATDWRSLALVIDHEYDRLKRGDDE